MDAVRWDLSNRIPLWHLSYMLDKFIPLWYIRTIYKHICDGSLETFKYSRKTRLSPEHYASLIFAGSLGDGLVVPDKYPRQNDTIPDANDIDALEKESRGYDVDIAYVRPDMVAGYEGSRTAYIIDTLHTRPGYFWLRAGAKGPHIKSSYLTDSLSMRMTSMGLEHSATGPALTESLSAWDVDHVSTGVCLDWPREAEGWLTRPCPSGWPSSSMRENIASRGCNFVAKAHRLSYDATLEFRFSLIVATKEIIDKISPRQRQCYVVFKALLKHAVQPMEFSSYCLKTVFLWSLEKIPSHEWNHPLRSLATCLLTLLDDLVHGLIDGNIRQYFMPECNLIEHLSRQELKNNIRQIVALRRNMLDTVLEYDDRYFTRGLLYFPLSDVFQALLSTAREPNQGIKDCLEIHIGLNFRYFKECLNGHMLYGTLNIIKEIQMLALINDPNDVTLSLTQFMQEYAGSSDLTSAFGERKSGEIIALLAALCEMIHYRSQPDERHTEDFLLNDMMMALSHKQLYGSNFVYFAFFLMKRGYTDEAIVNLKRALSVNKTKDMVVFEFFFMMKDHLDTILKHLLYTRAYLLVPAHILAYYLLTQIYKQAGKLQEAESLLKDFSKDCERCYAVYGVVHCHLLFAWSCMSIGRYWEAADAFAKDITLPEATRKDNTVKMLICRLLALYHLVRACHTGSG